VSSKIAGEPADVPSDRHQQGHSELGIAAKKRTRVIVAAQDAEPAVNDRVDASLYEASQ
jgi:hypothetical protein